MSETWLALPGERYEVSNEGRVRNLHGRVLNGVTTPRNYVNVMLSHGGVKTSHQVHRLVASAFLGDHPGLVVRHLDGDPQNNRLENLAWGTQSENNYDTVAHGRHKDASKTHCIRGHEFTPENTGTQPSGRYCIACRRRRTSCPDCGLDIAVKALRLHRHRFHALLLNGEPS